MSVGGGVEEKSVTPPGKLNFHHPPTKKTMPGLTVLLLLMRTILMRMMMVNGDGDKGESGWVVRSDNSERGKLNSIESII